MDKQTSRMMMEIQLDNICKIVNGTWKHSSTVNSRGEKGEKITIYYSNPDVSGSDSSDS